MNTKRIVYEQLVSAHPEYKHFTLGLLAKHLSLTLHLPLTVNHARNLRRRGVILWRGFLPKVGMISTQVRESFAYLYSLYFEHREDRGTYVVEDCHEKQHHTKCVRVTFKRGREKKVEHIRRDSKLFLSRFVCSERMVEKSTVYAVSKTERFQVLPIVSDIQEKTQKRFFVRIKKQLKRKTDIEFLPVVHTNVPNNSHSLSRIAWQISEGKKKGTIVDEKLFRIETVVHTEIERTYKTKKEQGIVKRDGIVRRSLYKTHLRYGDSISLRRFWGGTKQPLPTFTVKDIEQSLCEYLWLCLQGLSENSELNKLAESFLVVPADDKRERSKRALDMGNYLCSVGGKMYQSMLRKETAKVYRYDNRIDFAEAIDGVCSPVLIGMPEEAE